MDPFGLNEEQRSQHINGTDDRRSGKDIADYGMQSIAPDSHEDRIINNLVETVHRAHAKAENAKSALEFFGKHPEFAEFIVLVRSGAIHF